MKLNFTLFFLLLLLCLAGSVYGQKKHKKKIVTTANVLDTSVAGIRYNNVKSIYDSLSGSPKMESIAVSYSNNQNDAAYFDFANASQTQYINFTGSGYNESANTRSYRFKVSYNVGRNNIAEATTLKNTEFVTENGIYLGMDFKDFLSKFSHKEFDRIQLGEFDIYRFYGDEQFDTTTGTVSCNYIALYKFYNNTLVEFLFGKYDRWYNYIKDIMDGNSLYLKYQDVSQY